MAHQTRDHEVLDHIQRLTNEEHRLYEQGSLAARSMTLSAPENQVSSRLARAVSGRPVID